MIYYLLNSPPNPRPPWIEPPLPQNCTTPPASKRLKKKTTRLISWCVQLTVRGWDDDALKMLQICRDESLLRSCAAPVCSLIASLICQLKERNTDTVETWHYPFYYLLLSFLMVQVGQLVICNVFDGRGADW